jgi:hypothetical protein
MILNLAGVIGLVILLIYLTRRLSSSQPQPVSLECLDHLSIQRYKSFLLPVDSLGNESLATPQMPLDLLIREYLRDLKHDFECTWAIVKAIMLQSKRDRPDLASVLLRSQIAFARAIVIVRCRLLAYRFGITS